MSRLNSALLRAMQPTPRHVGEALSDGAVVRAQHDGTPEGGFHVRLVHHCATKERPGHWTVLYGTMSGFVDSVLVAHTDFAALYEVIQDHASDVPTRGPARRGGWQWFQAEQMLRAFILDHYNPDDASEAAERTLVALGSTPRFMPVTISQPATTNSTENT